MSAGLSHPTVTVKRQVIERDGGFCLYALPGCQGEATTTDHRAGRGAGGSKILNDPRNLTAICGICNGHKESMGAIVTLDLEMRGLYIRMGATNHKTLQRAIETPVEYLDGEIYYLISATERRHISLGRPEE